MTDDALVVALVGLKVIWVTAAWTKLAAGLRCWQLLRRARDSAAGQMAKPSTRAWTTALIVDASSHAWVGGLNLLLALYALTVPPPAEPTWRAYVAPAVLVLLALLGLRGVVAVDRGYRKVVRRQV